MSERDSKMAGSKAMKSARVLPPGSSYNSLNPNRFKTQFYGVIARNEIEKKQAMLKREMERLSAEMRELENQAKVIDGGEAEVDSDDDFEDDMDPLTMTDHEFESVFEPEEMRTLALVAHNHMKPAMRQFVLDNKNILKKFRLSGTNTTMTMLHEVFGDDPSVRYGAPCQSGPLGGDAELVALMCMEELGGMVFLQDPMDAHPHHADIECLNRQALVHDVLVAGNVTSAYAMTAVLRLALRKGKKGMIPSFFTTEYSPAVAEFIKRMDEGNLSKSYRRFDSIGVDVNEAKLEVERADYGENGEEEKDAEQTKRDAWKALHSGQSMKKGLSVAILNVQVENKAHRRMSSMTSGAETYKAAQAVAQIEDEDFDFDGEEEDLNQGVFTEVKDPEFFSQFLGEEMRSLALLAHDHMQPALKEFILHNKNLLKKFRLTGPRTTMTMLKEVYGDDPMVRYGPTCQSGFLGGDAQLCALMCLEELGGMVFFQDPMESHPHQVDIDCLNRQAQVHDIYVASNPSSAYAMMTVLRRSLKKGNRARISSFFETKKSPSVAEYKRRQQAVLDSNIAAAAQKAKLEAAEATEAAAPASALTSEKKSKRGFWKK